MRHVILPQALRIAVPPTVGFLVQVIKGTALASVIGFVELTKAGTHDHQRHLQALRRSTAASRCCTSRCASRLSLYAKHLERKTPWPPC